ncbi:LuxR C-terminal-related transcriptional regulator [Clostridium perfringens]|uniref:LuxR C-terminal-related transcriptional regulator n=1 Tax=Clostridium perfringens TaxID=1502 RepID=UPI0037544323
MKFTRENLRDSHLLDCKIKNLLIDKEYNSEIDKTLLDKEIERLTEFKNEIDNILPTLTEKELDVLNIITGTTKNQEVANKYDVTFATICNWEKSLLNKMNK